MREGGCDEKGKYNINEEGGGKRESGLWLPAGNHDESNAICTRKRKGRTVADADADGGKRRKARGITRVTAHLTRIGSSAIFHHKTGLLAAGPAPLRWKRPRSRLPGWPRSLA